MISVGTTNWTPKCPVTISHLRTTRCSLRESNYSTSCMDRNDLSLLKILYGIILLFVCRMSCCCVTQSCLFILKLQISPFSTRWQRYERLARDPPVKNSHCYHWIPTTRLLSYKYWSYMNLPFPKLLQARTFHVLCCITLSLQPHRFLTHYRI